jgi:transcription antitermination factor NusG
MIQPFPPGTRVRVIDGTFVSMTGVVITTEEAEWIHAARGGQRPTLRDSGPGSVRVALPIFGQSVPVELAISQLEAVS